MKEKVTIKKSKLKNQKDNKSKLKAQNSKPQLKTQNLLLWHPEGSLSVILRAKPEGSHTQHRVSS